MESQAGFGEGYGDKETLDHVYKGFNTLLRIGGEIRESALFWGRDSTYLKPVQLAKTCHRQQHQNQ